MREDFSDIAMKTATADISFAVSDDGRCGVVCYEAEKEKHSVAVEKGTLMVNIVDGRKWHKYLGITTGTPITILPYFC